jgi:hypothetical protein
MTLRKALITMLPSTTTASTLRLITTAFCTFTVMARAEQMPSTCTVMGLLSFSGSVMSLRFFLLKSPCGFRLGRCCTLGAHWLSSVRVVVESVAAGAEAGGAAGATTDFKYLS